jgi:PAS domain S-box-containing protein/putative nucleotidyltransferase with HDIG domain
MMGEYLRAGRPTDAPDDPGAARVGNIMDVGDTVGRIAQEALLNAIPTPAFFIGPDYRYAALNDADRAVVRALYSRDVVVGDSILDVATPEERDVFRSNIDRALAGETLTEARWFGSDPKTRRYHVITYAPYPREGTVLGVAAVALDQTEVRRAEEALQRSDEKFAAAFHASPDAININRLSDGMYVEVNEGFTELTGFTPADVEGRTSTELSIWDDPADRDRLVAGLRERESVDGMEARFRRKDGSVTVAEMSARIIEVDGEPCVLSVTRDISERRRVEQELQSTNIRLEKLSHDVVGALGRVSEVRDPYTQGHEQRSSELCRLIGEEMKLSPADIDMLETAALVHDIGKLNVPAEILTKPGTLTSLEFGLIKEHPQHGYEILSVISFDRPIAEIVFQHHERMDGSGYPRGLRGDQISFGARVLAVADVVEAMVTHRPYREALGLDAAVEELRAHPEKYDAAVVAAFFALCDGDCIKL